MKKIIAFVKYERFNLNPMIIALKSIICYKNNVWREGFKVVDLKMHCSK
jgi:hypothetical protein